MRLLKGRRLEKEITHLAGNKSVEREKKRIIDVIC
jgi:hypothetical protein